MNELQVSWRAAMAQAHAGNLPAETTSFVGRRRELATAKRLLGACRMVTFTGTGGVGKTRLALRMAAELRRSFPHGVWLVDVAPLAAGELLPQLVAEALGLQNPSGVGALSDYLAGRRLLLILDGCEHLPGDCAVLAATLLSAAPHLRILATSRQILHVDGEHLLDVPPLSVPERDDIVPADAVARYESVSLFADRAAAVVPDFTITAANGPAVLRLCRRLEGVPLAVELAAVRMRALSVQQIVDRLDDRFRILVGHEDPTVAPRQRTLQAMVEWSYDLCSPEERTLWQRLSVFAGGCSLEAAERVCTGEQLAQSEIAGLITGLVDKSVLLRRDSGSGTRYQMLETFQAYGRDRLVESGHETALLRRHSHWCRDLTAEVEAEWFGPDQPALAAEIRAEQSNIDAALEFCLSERGETRCALQIAASMWGHRLSWVSLRDGHHWLRRALASDLAPTPTRAKALWVDAWLLLLRGRPAEALPLLEEARTLAERLGDEEQLAGITQVRGLAALLAGDFTSACALLEQALGCYRRAGDRRRSWICLFQLSMAAVCDFDPRAGRLCRACREECDRENARWSLSQALWVTGLERWRHGDCEAGTKAACQALRGKAPFNDHLGIAHCVELLAWLAADVRRYQYAAELLGGAEGIWESIGTSIPGLGILAHPHARYVARLRLALGDHAFRTACATGRNLDLDEVIALALDDQAEDRSGPEPAALGIASALTPRERQIAGLVARGLSNKEIANTLVIAQRTAEGHVEHILHKLGFRSRSQIAAAWGATVPPERDGTRWNA